jgi:hypothetical protein
MKIERNVVIAILIGFAVCWFASNGCTLQPSKPLADRPILRWIAKAAKTFLWVAVFVEPAPEPTAKDCRTVKGEHEEVGADGFPLVKHSRGW